MPRKLKIANLSDGKLIKTLRDKDSSNDVARDVNHAITKVKEGRRRKITFLERDRKAFGELIELAEKVQREVDELRKQTLRVLGGTSLVATVMSTIFLQNLYIGERFNSSTNFIAYMLSKSSFTTSLMVMMLFCFLMIVYYLGRISIRIRREKRAFREVMGIVHEVFQGIKNEMSVLEVAEYKIRLSRLDN